MSAPKGNKFWEIRSTHGRDKLFETPELLWEAACEYFEWCEENPFMAVEQARSSRSKKDVEVDEEGIKTTDTGLIEIPRMRPYTIHGLCLYLDCGTAYFRNFKNEERANSKDFKSVINKIEETIYNQKFSGAASGFLKENIIARDLGLADKQERSGNQTFELIIPGEDE